MVAIEYIDKEVNEINELGIDATLITYKVKTENMMKLSELNLDPESYKPMRLFVYKDDIYDLLTDDMELGRMILASDGEKEGESIIKYCIVRKGLELLLPIINPQ